VRYASRLQHYLALKNEIFSSTDRAYYKNAQIFYYGTVRANAFLRTDLFEDNRGTVRAFEINKSERLKRSLF
jgi:hypothetical protein